MRTDSNLSSSFLFYGVFLDIFRFLSLVWPTCVSCLLFEADQFSTNGIFLSDSGNVHNEYYYDHLGLLYYVCTHFARNVCTYVRDHSMTCEWRRQFFIMSFSSCQWMDTMVVSFSCFGALLQLILFFRFVSIIINGGWPRWNEVNKREVVTCSIIREKHGICVKPIINKDESRENCYYKIGIRFVLWL